SNVWTISHETSHQWGAFLPASLGLNDTSGHFLSNNNVSSALGGCAWRDNGNGTFTSLGNFFDAGKFGDLMLYLMGLLPREQLGTTYIAETANQQFCTVGAVINGPFRQVRLADIEQAAGARAPAGSLTPVTYGMAYVVLSEGRLLTPVEMTMFNR